MERVTNAKVFYNETLALPISSSQCVFQTLPSPLNPSKVTTIRKSSISFSTPHKSINIDWSDPQRIVLEIGTFIGFSTLGWIEAVGPNGHVTALEFSPEYAAIAEQTFAKNGTKNAEVIVGDARESWVKPFHFS